MPLAKLRDWKDRIVLNSQTLGLGLSLAGITFVLDQVSKWLILYVVNLPQQFVIELTGFLNLRMAWNAGVSFGLFQANSIIGRMGLILFALAVVGFLLYWLNQAANRLTTAAIGLVIGGAIGNIFDRAIYGAVVDFVDFHLFGYHFYTFNIADTAISVGVALLIFDAVFGPARGQDRSRQKTSELSGKMD